MCARSTWTRIGPLAQSGSSPQSPRPEETDVSEEKKNVERMRQIFEEMERTGSPQPLLEQMAEDAVYKLTVPPGTPLSGEFRGKRAITDCFGLVDEVLEVLEVHTWDFIGNGKQVIVLGDERFVVRRTGKVRQSEFAFVVDFRDGMIARVLVIEDLSSLVEDSASASGRVSSRASG
jgi:ketosteroid isomerase-like protein